MRHLFASVLCAAFLATSAAAQDADSGDSLMERGLELFFEGLRDEMSPALDGMRQLTENYGPAVLSFLDEMGPAFGDMLDRVKDWSAYHPPEFLPNGDIIIRKKASPENPKPDLSDPSTPIMPPPAGQTDI